MHLFERVFILKYLINYFSVKIMRAREISANDRSKTIVMVGSILLIILGSVAIVGGAVVFYFNSGTDAEGYAMSPVFEVRSSANAFVLWVAPMKESIFSWLGEDNIAQTKWVVKAADSGTQVFAGWINASDGGSYVSQFMYETSDQDWFWRISPYYAKIDVPSTKIVNQDDPTRPPTDEIFWLDSVVTNESATIYWDPSWDESEGMKMIMLMNADGSKGVNADLQLGFKVPILTWLPLLLIPLGIVLCIGGYLLLKKKRKA
jgi:hypothetical protein